MSIFCWKHDKAVRFRWRFYGQWGMDTLEGAADGADPRGTPVAIADSHNDD